MLKFSWPPPEHASGCIEALGPDDNWHKVHLFHYVKGGSKWGYCTKTYCEHGEQETQHPDFEFWRWLGPQTPSPAEQGSAIMVWAFYSAPGYLRSLSTHGGDEDWVGLLPHGESPPSWMWDGTGFGCCSVDEHKLDDGRLVCIGAHA